MEKLLIDDTFNFSEEYFSSWLTDHLNSSNLLLAENLELFLDPILTRKNNIRIKHNDLGELKLEHVRGNILQTPAIKKAYIKSRLFSEDPLLHLETSKLTHVTLHIEIRCLEWAPRKNNPVEHGLFGLLLSHLVEKISKLEPGHDLPDYPDDWVDDILSFAEELGIIEHRDGNSKFEISNYIAPKEPLNKDIDDVRRSKIVLQALEIRSRTGLRWANIASELNIPERTLRNWRDRYKSIN